MEMGEGNIRGQGHPSQTAARTATIARRSGVYEHFTDAQGDNNWQCKHCHLVVGANTNHGTSNLWKHLKKKCKGWDHQSSSLPQLQLQVQPSGLPGESSDREPAGLGEDEAMPLLQPSGPGETSDREPAGREEDEASRDLARMIALHGYDPSVVEDDYFRSFVRRLNPEFELPSREAIEKMCSGIFRDSRRDLYRFDEDDPGKVSVALGQSKTIETGQIVYATTHFIDHNWNLHREVKDVLMALPVGDHYHVPLRQVPVVSLDDVVYEIVFRNEEWDYQKVLFMVAGETTGHINHQKLKDCLEKEGLAENIYSATYMDHVLHSIARCLLPDSNFAKKIFKTIEDLDCDFFIPPLTDFGLLDKPWEYNEHWYSCYCSLEILQLSPVPSGVSPRILKILRTLWRVIYRAIKRVSNSSRPTSNICLQELFTVRGVLKSQLSKTPPAAHAGNYRGFGNKNAANVLREALKTVDKAIQDSYLVWSIPLVLDPRYKIKHIEIRFKRVFGLEAKKYVDEVRKKIKELYTSYSEDVDDTEDGDDIEDDDDTEDGDDIEDGDEDSDGSTEEMSVDGSTHLEQALDEQCHSKDNSSHAEAKTQLDRYLHHSRVCRTKGFDILKWWKVHGSELYPAVARMARDALAMPTCSKLNPDQMAQVKSMLRGY